MVVSAPARVAESIMRGSSSNRSICPKPTFSRRKIIANEILKYHADALMQIIGVNLAQIDAVDQHLSLAGIVQARQQLFSPAASGAMNKHKRE